MWKDLSMIDKSRLMQRLGIFDPATVQQMYDGYHVMASGGSPDWDPDNPYHYHTKTGEKVVITPEDWEKHKGQPYFKQVEDAVLAEQAAHPGPEYIINPQFSKDLRMAYKGNMGPKYQNYSSFSGNLPQGYSFTPEGLVQDNQGNLYVQKGFRQTPRFTYDESSTLTFPVLEGRNRGNVTFYPVNMEKNVIPVLPVSSVMNVDRERNSYIDKYISNNSLYEAPYMGELIDFIPEDARTQHVRENTNSEWKLKHAYLTKDRYDSVIQEIKKDFEEYYPHLDPSDLIKEFKTQGKWIKPSYKEAEKKAVIEIEPLIYNGVLPNEYKSGGSIHINPKNKGKFTETMRRTGKSAQQLLHSKNPLTRKRAQFAINSRKWNHKHQPGGYLDGIPITKDGYNVLDRYKNPYAIVPGNVITMKNLPYRNQVPIEGIGLQSGKRITMFPGGRYLFGEDKAVLEIPHRNQLGGNMLQSISNTLKKYIDNYNSMNSGFQGVYPAIPDGEYRQLVDYVPQSKIDYMQTVWDHLKDIGVSPYNAAAIMGNVMQESSFNPKAKNPKSSAYGLLQMIDSQRKKADPWISKNGLDSDMGQIDWYLHLIDDNIDDYMDAYNDFLNRWDSVKQAYENNPSAYNTKAMKEYQDYYDTTYKKRVDNNQMYSVKQLQDMFNSDDVSLADRTKMFEQVFMKAGKEQNHDKRIGYANDILHYFYPEYETYQQSRNNPQNYVDGVYQYDWYGNPIKKQYGGIVKPFSYKRIPVVRYPLGGYLFGY